MRYFLFVSLLCLSTAATWSLEIPVRRGGSAGSSVGYVDMEQVFREYPEAKKAREEYQKEVVRQRMELAERERDLGDLKREIETLKGSLPVPQEVNRSSSTVDVLTSGASPSSVEFPSLSTASAVALEMGLRKREEQWLTRQKELEEARARSADTLRDFEAARARTILGRLYKALVELADERGIGLVVDKSAILYGQSAIDLTEPLNRRVRGLPDEEK